VVKALGYKPEDCKFETRWGEILKMYLLRSYFEEKVVA
jgi:hypothetical protein